MKNKKTVALLLLGLVTTAQAQQATTVTGGVASGSRGTAAIIIGTNYFTQVLLVRVDLWRRAFNKPTK
jgi:hypothetical protein